MPMKKMNYQKEMEAQISSLRGSRPSLLLHSCCGPCSSYVLECLTKHFGVTVFFYNPNIYPREEYEKRLAAQRRLLRDMPADIGAKVDFIQAEYDPQSFSGALKGLEDEPEGGARCARCISMRMEAAARTAGERGFEFFTTTLSVSPHKDAELINHTGGLLAEKYEVGYLFADFKKRDGYRRSVALSEKYGLYRQNYCGCRYSVYPNNNT